MTATQTALDRLPSVPRETHPCGRCMSEAAYLDRSPSTGVTAYVCYACGDHKGYPTLVAMPAARSIEPVQGER